jgi:hypothetical protein
MKTPVFHNLLLVILMSAWALLAVACAAQGTPTPTAVATTAPTLPPPTATSAPSPTPATATSTLPPTVAVASPTASATATPLALATPQRAGAGVTALPDLTGLRVVTTTNTSQDGKWNATGLAAFPRSAPDNYYTRLIVAGADGQTAWTVVDQWSRYGMGYTTPQPFLWSRDGRAFYFTNMAHPDGCAPFVNATDLYRVDLNTGAVTQIAPSVGLWLALSPDETKLAYAGFRERGLVVSDLATGREQETGLKLRQNANFGDAIGRILWSADGSTIIYTIANRPCSGAASKSQTVFAESTSIVRLDVATMRQTPLLSDDIQLRMALEWASADKLLVRDKDGQTWLLDVTTGQLEKK